MSSPGMGSSSGFREEQLAKGPNTPHPSDLTAQITTRAGTEVTPVPLTTPYMARKTHTLFAVAMAALLLTAGLAGPMAATATAQEDGGGIVDGLIPDDSGNGFNASVIQTAVFSWVEANTPVGEEVKKANATHYARETKRTFNQNSSRIRNWTNERFAADTDNDVFRIRFSDKSGNSKWMFIVSNVNTTEGNYTSARMMNLTEFRNTNREYDKTYKLDPYASRNANDELERFISNRVAKDRGLTRQYRASLSGYKGHVGGDVPEELKDGGFW